MATKDDVSVRRRNFLRSTLGVVPAIALSGGGACIVPAVKASPAPTPDYKPVYFSDAEWAFVNAAAERFIPASEDGPSAKEAGVPEFIDRQMQTDYGYGGRWYLQGPFDPQAPDSLGYQLRFNPREFYRAAVADIDGWCQRMHGKPFVDLDPGIQEEVLGRLQHGEIDLPNVKASEFFSQLLNNTKEGYFADPMYGGNRSMGGWKMIGFPGARGDYADWAKHPGEAYPLGPVSILGEKG